LAVVVVLLARLLACPGSATVACYCAPIALWPSLLPSAFFLLPLPPVMGKKGAAAGGGGKGKGKGGGSGGGGADDGKLATCNFVKARHILCEKQGKINDAYKELRDGWLDDGSKVPGPKFGEVRRRLPPLVATSAYACSAVLLSRCTLREVSLVLSVGLY